VQEEVIKFNMADTCALSDIQYIDDSTGGETGDV
jgi:hypothetical protein